MSNFTFTLQVNIGLAPALERLVERFLSQGGEAARPLPLIKEPTVVPMAADPTPEPQPEPQPEAEVPRQEQPLKEGEYVDFEGKVAAIPETTAEEASVEDVRAAIDSARRRIQGEDYLSNPSSEGNTRYKKALTKALKLITETINHNYGVEFTEAADAGKPTKLSPQLRKIFIEQAAELYLDADGEIQTKLPF